MIMIAIAGWALNHQIGKAAVSEAKGEEVDGHSHQHEVTGMDEAIHGTGFFRDPSQAIGDRAVIRVLLDRWTFPGEFLLH